MGSIIKHPFVHSFVHSFIQILAVWGELFLKLYGFLVNATHFFLLLTHVSCL